MTLMSDDLADGTPVTGRRGRVTSEGAAIVGGAIRRERFISAAAPTGAVRRSGTIRQAGYVLVQMDAPESTKRVR